jgi:hypothetical protein
VLPTAESSTNLYICLLSQCHDATSTVAAAIVYGQKYTVAQATSFLTEKRHFKDLKLKIDIDNGIFNQHVKKLTPKFLYLLAAKYDM